MTDCECVFERADLPELGDDELIDHVERCGTCPKVHTGAARVLLARLQGSARDLRRSANRARQAERELAELRVDVDRTEQRIANLERVHKVSTREVLQKNALLAMISSITIAANEAHTEADVYRICMHKVCSASGWSLARLTPASGGTSRWHVADRLAAEFTRLLVDGEPTALGLDALRGGKPVWAPDLRARLDAPWIERAAGLGLRGGAALPVVVGGHVIAVVEFFGTAGEGTATALMLAMATIGAEIGRVLARLRADEAVAHARDAAEGASRAKSAFLASMSHELRTPLNAILGYADLVHDVLEEEEGAGAVREDIVRIRQAGEHLLGLINNILDLSKVEAGFMPVLTERFDLGALIRDTADLLKPLMDRRNNVACLDLADDLADVETDPTLVRQILFNLVSNASKFTHAGTITIAAARQTDPSGAPWFQLSVADTGVGMTEEQCAQLFEPYRQVDPRLARRAGGTGLGLTLCRGLCTLLGGTIAVYSAPGRGSCFTVRLPLH
ncbi:Signal transduction histidine kinase [Nannocystis exedens]|uniref:histidine kinase n=1 Tax=Nannocystis exedens TaxID=54 RepID=A0A1I2FNI3_9BACT|nr:GAF domain-containing protein [Nannocystis exedens]PCC74471.1 Non-motile and phage-resistance protein [Nannocystis exedens]SFF06338.1 Signal transduction histidine kinase [Nannocystis exedens]